MIGSKNIYVNYRKNDKTIIYLGCKIKLLIKYVNIIIKSLRK